MFSSFLGDSGTQMWLLVQMLVRRGALTPAEAEWLEASDGLYGGGLKIGDLQKAVKEGDKERVEASFLLMTVPRDRYVETVKKHIRCSKCKGPTWMEGSMVKQIKCGCGQAVVDGKTNVEFDSAAIEQELGLPLGTLDKVV